MARLWLPVLGVFLIFSAIVLRLGHLQLFMHTQLSSKTNKELSHKTRVRPLRGRIFDANGRLMAVTVERPSIFLSTRDLKISTAQAIKEIKKNLPHLDLSALNKKTREKAGFIWIQRMANASDGEKIKKAKIQGLGVEFEGKRLYPAPSLAREFLGNVGVDGEGTNGLERALDPLLNGLVETKIVLKDALGKVFAEREAPKISSKSKNKQGPFDIYLTLDARLQALAEEHIAKALERHGAKRSIVLVQDVATGELLVAASKAAGPAGDLKNLDPNYALSLTFEPGSVLKPLVLAAALNEGVLKENETINCEMGRYQLTRDVEIEDHEPRGILAVRDVLAYSSNIGFAKIGLRLGSEPLYRAWRAFGFGTKTALPVTGEAVGLIKAPDSWSKTTLPMMSFGQEIGVTPIQLTSAFSALANGGELMEPKIISEIRALRSAQTLYATRPRRVRKVFADKVNQRVLSMMEDAVTYGTGVKAQIPGYRVAGKTGTAQKVDPQTGKYSRTRVVVSFCGLVPLPNPRLAICAILDEPTKPKVAWASDIAAPLFKEVAQDAINFLSIEPPHDPTTSPTQHRSKTDET